MKYIIKYGGNVIIENGFTLEVCKDIVHTLSKMKANFLIEYDKKIVDGKSILGLMSLAVPQKAFINFNGEVSLDDIGVLDFLLKKYVDVMVKSSIPMEV